MNRLFLCAVLVSVTLPPVVSAAADKFVEPTGFGKAKFGMSVAEVHKLYPKMQPTKGTEEAMKKGGQLVLIYDLEDQSVGPLKPCAANLRFFNDELYEVQFHCPDRVKVGQYLQKTYGEPTRTTEKAVFWMGKHNAVSLAPKTGAFGFSNLVRTQALQSILLNYLGKTAAQGGEAPAAGASGTSPTPAEAPAAPAHE